MSRYPMRVTFLLASLVAVLPGSAVLAAPAGRSHPMQLACDGKSSTAVVVAADASVAEKHAAEELAGFLQQVTGATLSVTERYSPARTCLLVGPGAASAAIPGFTADGLGQDGLIIQTVGKDLILAGDRPRGTLYAVYAFLEEVVGCRWWTPAASTIPARPSLALPALDIRQVPAFEYREPYWADALDPDWCVRNRVVGSHSELDAARGGRHADIGGVHSFYRYMPPATYYSQHPEWFSEIAGKRVADNAQLCLTNAAAAQEFARLAIADIRAHYPGATSVWVSQNDWDGHCECADCKRAEQAEGTPAAPLLQFVNRVAQQVAEQFPDVSVNTLAYDWTQEPPRSLRPLPNVVIWLCTTGCSYGVPYAAPRNRVFREALDGWAKVCDRIYIWDYVTNFAAYLCCETQN